MEARLELLEEVQNEADGEEAEEEGLWVRACSPFSDEPIGVGNLTSKHGGVLDRVSLEMPFFLLKILSKAFHVSPGVSGRRGGRFSAQGMG